MNLQDAFHPEFCQKVLCHSDTALRLGIDNCCPPQYLDNLKRLSQFLARLQLALGLPSGALKVGSGFRCAQLNASVGGVSNSQHCLGLAADITAPGFLEPFELATRAASQMDGFDQLILEFGRWVHVSVCPPGVSPRGQVLTIYSADAGYLEGIVPR